MDAASKLYGLISLDELHALYNSQNQKVDALSFLMAVSVIDREDNNDLSSSRRWTIPGKRKKNR